MSVKLLSWVFEHSPTSGNERLVLLVLADEADDEGFCFPGFPRIAMKANIHRATAIRVVRRLEDAGLLVVDRPVRNGPGKHNCYWIVTDESYPHRSQNAPFSTSHIGRNRKHSKVAPVLPDPRTTHRPAGASQKQEHFSPGSGVIRWFKPEHDTEAS